MDYYESVVLDYLRADRAVFLNTEYCLQVKPGQCKGLHWFCDAVALDLRSATIFLCEISYAEGLAALIKRLRAWHEHWEGIRIALERDSSLLESWAVRPWLFVPEKSVPLLVKRLGQIGDELHPVITPLEMVQPWCWSYRDGSRNHERLDLKAEASVPENMRGYCE